MILAGINPQIPVEISPKSLFGNSSEILVEIASKHVSDNATYIYPRIPSGIPPKVISGIPSESLSGRLPWHFRRNPSRQLSSKSFRNFSSCFSKVPSVASPGIDL